MLLAEDLPSRREMQWMLEKNDSSNVPRIAHYFRDVDLTGKSCPDFIPEAFPMNCEHEDLRWSAGFLLRVAVRFQHIWATYGVRNGQRTIEGKQPAVCFSAFSLEDLIAVSGGFAPRREACTQYAITLPLEVAEIGGIHRVVGGALQVGEQTRAISGAGVCDSRGRFETSRTEDLQFTHSESYPEWRWYFSGDYSSYVAKFEEFGWGESEIPGLKLSQDAWTGIGIVVPDVAAARAVQYDILSLVDRGVVSASHFDHILVCDQLPTKLSDLDGEEARTEFSRACLDFKSCIGGSASEADVSELEFSSRLLILECSTPKGDAEECGGCWLWFEDNAHPYVRALLRAGRVKVNEQGRYLASLDELDPDRNLRERQAIALALSKELEEKYGVRSSYYSVLNSGCPDGAPSFSGGWGYGGYTITDGLEGADE